MADETLEFALLGLLRVVVAGRPVEITSMRQRALLAALVLRAGRPVSHARLTDAIWRDHEPRDPRAALQLQVMRLRRALGTAAALVRTDGEAYRLDVDPQVCDVHRFRALIRSSYGAARPGDVLREALELWRGDALADVRSEALAPSAAALEDERLNALERRIQLDLADDQHLRVVGELSELVAQWPHRESFWAQLMVALARSGRQTEALAAYREVRARLRDEIGIEPGPELQRAHTAVLAGTPGGPEPASPTGPDPVLESAPHWSAQQQLPPDVADFVGRADLVDAIAGALLDQRTVPVVVISGMAGVGKTALAVHVAHRLRETFPDGQWYLPLRAGSGEQRTSQQLLDSLLRTSGIEPAMLPDDVDGMSALLRSRLADRRVLLLLDDAALARQIEPLLPGSPGNAVLVTSRSQLAELTVRHGARPYPLSSLTPDESQRLLSSLLGSTRVAEQAETAREIAALCGHLPLALRIASANLVHQPALPLHNYARRLAQNRLSALSIPGSTAVLREAFDVSVAALPPDSRRAFSLLGSAPGADLSTDGVAALLGVSAPEAEQALDALQSASLVDRSLEGRCGMHDLVREHAAALAGGLEADDLAAARERLFSWYWQTVEDANAAADFRAIARLPHPVGDASRFAGVDEARAWVEAELPSLVVAIGQAATDGPAHAAWEITDALRVFLYSHRHLASWRTLMVPALGAAEASGEPVPIAAMQHSAGVLALCSGDRTGARQWYVQAIAGYRRGGHTLGEAALLSNVGVVDTDDLHLEQALGYISRALDAFQRAGRADLAALTIANRADVKRMVGQLRDAVADATAALDLNGQRAHAVALMARAAAYRLLGCEEDAIADATAALELSRDRDETGNVAAASLELARCYLNGGQAERAVVVADQARRLADESVDEQGSFEAVTVLGAAYLAGGDADLAISTLRHGLESAQSAAQQDLPAALITLARALLVRGDPLPAQAEAEQALKLAQRASLRVDECRVLSVMAAIHDRLGRESEASRCSDRAAEIAAETGFVPPPNEVYADPAGSR